MKKTTYIIIGMLVGTVCLIFGGIALLSALGHERGGFPTLVMKEREKTLQLPACNLSGAYDRCRLGTDDGDGDAWGYIEPGILHIPRYVAGRIAWEPFLGHLLFADETVLA